MRKRIRKRVVTVEVELLGEMRRIELGICLREDAKYRDKKEGYKNRQMNQFEPYKRLIKLGFALILSRAADRTLRCHLDQLVQQDHLGAVFPQG
ncbi:MAG: hypothetical protein ACLTR6_14195 [Clostridium fessum]